MSSSAKFLLVFISLLLIVLIAILLKNEKRNIEKTKEIKENIVEIQKIKEDRIMEKVLQIASCESSLNPRAINFKDSDSTASFGLLQFKPETFKMYAVKYGILGEKADWNWIMTIIFDEQTQKRLGYMILKNEPETAKKLWGNCY